MKNLLLLIALLFTVNANAQKFHDYKATTSTSYSLEAFKESWAKEAACIKKGGKIIAVSESFKSRGYGYGDCSSSAQAIMLNKKLNRTIDVFKLAFLPASIIKKLAAAKRI